MDALQSALAVARDFEFEPPDPATWQAFFGWVTTTFDAFYQEILERYGDEEDFAPVAAWAGALGNLMGALQSSLEVARDFEFVAPDPATWQAFFGWVTTTFDQFAQEIAEHYEDPEDLPPVAAWGGALSSLMQGLQSALDLASGFSFTTPDPDTWDNFFDWTTTVFEEFRAEIERRYPADDPDQFAPVMAWSNAFSALMSGLQSAISLVSEFEFEAPDPEDWDEFFEWTLSVLESFTDAITTRYPEATSSTWEPVVAWSNALGSLMSALENAAALADEFVFIAPTALGWDNFFDWTWAVFNAFLERIEAEFPETPEEAAATFAPVIAFSDAISAIFNALQNGLSFFMEMNGPGAAFWEFIGGASGNPDTSPFAQRMGYIIGAITGTMAAFEAWVLADAPEWNSNAQTLLENVQDVIDVLQDALDLFDVAQGITFPTTGEIQQFVQAVLQLFVSFSNGLTGLVTGPNGISGSISSIEAATTEFVTDMQPVIGDWYDVGEALVEALEEGMEDQFGSPTTTGTLVDAFIAGMQSNLANVYTAAYAIGETAGQGLAAGAGLPGAPSGTMLGIGEGGWSGWSSTPTSLPDQTINVVVRFENAPAGLDRRALNELKNALVYELKRGA
jgi:hypothetical protein